MEKSKKKAMGSLQSIVELYRELYKEGTIEKGSSGYTRMLQLENIYRHYGRGRTS
jgi:hypothetical protein